MTTPPPTFRGALAAITAESDRWAKHAGEAFRASYAEYAAAQEKAIPLLRSTGDQYDRAVADLLATISEHEGIPGEFCDDVTRAARVVRDLAVRRAA